MSTPPSEGVLVDPSEVNALSDLLIPHLNGQPTGTVFAALLVLLYTVAYNHAPSVEEAEPFIRGISTWMEDYTLITMTQGKMMQ